MYLKEIPCINKVTISYHTIPYHTIVGISRDVVLPVLLRMCDLQLFHERLWEKRTRDNPERYCGRSLSSSRKLKRMARAAMDVCLRVLRKATKVSSKATVTGTVY